MSTSNYPAVHSEAASSPPLSPRLPAVMGTIFALLFLLGLWLVSTATDATLGKNALLKFYQSDQNRLLAIFGLYVIPFAGMAFLWFIASLHGWLIQSAGREDRLLSSMQLGSALIFVALLFCSTAAGAAIAISLQYLGTPVPGPETASQLPELAYTLFFVYALRAAATFTLVTSRFAQSMNVFPRWLSIVGVPGGDRAHAQCDLLSPARLNLSPVDPAGVQLPLLQGAFWVGSQASPTSPSGGVIRRAVTERASRTDCHGSYTCFFCKRWYCNE